jgi:DNA-binding GntR family transcriptional regulator
VGYVVKPISEQEVEEICEIRMAIEGVAARWAMEKAHKKLVEELKKNISISDGKVSKGEAKAFIGLDAQFHEIIARFSGSQRLLELAQTLRRHMLRYRIQSIYSVENVLRAIDGHKRIIRAIEKRNLEEISKAIKDHMEQSKSDILRYAFKETPRGKR